MTGLFPEDDSDEAWQAILQADYERRKAARRAAIDSMVASLSEGELDDLRGYKTPPPWRTIDPTEQREAFAAMLPASADRERFLANLEWAAVWYTTHTHQNMQIKNEDARRQLDSLGNAASSLGKAFARLGPLASERLCSEAEQADFNAADGLVECVRVRELRDDDGALIAPDLTTHNIVRLAHELEGWAEAARKSIGISTRKSDIPTRSAIRKIAFAWWIATGDRPRQVWSHEQRDDDPARDKGETGPLHVLSPMLLNPARKFLKQPERPSFNGIADQVCRELMAMDGPPTDIYAGLRQLGDPAAPRD